MAIEWDLLRGGGGSRELSGRSGLVAASVTCADVGDGWELLRVSSNKNLNKEYLSVILRLELVRL